MHDYTCLYTPVLRSSISEYSASAALFQCQHSTHQDGQVFIPNIPDSHFNHKNAANLAMGKDSLLTQSSPGITYFFTIPPESAERNCSGTVVAIQYCYRVHKNRICSAQDVFLFHSVTRDGFVFTVNSSFTVRTTPHQESECTRIEMHYYLCCDTTTLSADNQLSFSPDSYTFGVTIPIDEFDYVMYAFNANGEFMAEQVKSSLGTIPAGRSYILMESVSGGLLLMRLIGIFNYIIIVSL